MYIYIYMSKCIYIYICLNVYIDIYIYMNIHILWVQRIMGFISLSSKISGGLPLDKPTPQLWWGVPLHHWERWRPWSHAFQSASAPSCPGDFWWEGKGPGEAATELTSIGIVFPNPMKT